eukprot:TRINITY_DN23116_c0_g1_i1.p1 TRINITY_DN23116_c0_g1~~TRINITY_DN23116_c0_g1_i1.p1  ORF type:complete len:1583 (-),score=209.51 TRINITY_DN23116_c0_g1_i1:178-4926(-)
METFGLVHRDLRACNIQLLKGYESSLSDVKLLDLGVTLAAEEESRLNLNPAVRVYGGRHQTLAAGFDWLPPEVRADGQDDDGLPAANFAWPVHSFDAFSLGALGLRVLSNCSCGPELASGLEKRDLDKVRALLRSSLGPPGARPRALELEAALEEAAGSALHRSFSSEIPQKAMPLPSPLLNGAEQACTKGISEVKAPESLIAQAKERSDSCMSREFTYQAVHEDTVEGRSELSTMLQEQRDITNKTGNDSPQAHEEQRGSSCSTVQEQCDGKAELHGSGHHARKGHSHEHSLQSRKSVCNTAECGSMWAQDEVEEQAVDVNVPMVQVPKDMPHSRQAPSAKTTDDRRRWAKEREAIAKAIFSARDEEEAARRKRSEHVRKAKEELRMAKARRALQGMFPPPCSPALDRGRNFKRLRRWNEAPSNAQRMSKSSTDSAKGNDETLRSTASMQSASKDEKTSERVLRSQDNARHGVKRKIPGDLAPQGRQSIRLSKNESYISQRKTDESSKRYAVPCVKASVEPKQAGGCDTDTSDCAKRSWNSAEKDPLKEATWTPTQQRHFSSETVSSAERNKAVLKAKRLAERIKRKRSAKRVVEVITQSDTERIDVEEASALAREEVERWAMHLAERETRDDLERRANEVVARGEAEVPNATQTPMQGVEHLTTGCEDIDKTDERPNALEETKDSTVEDSHGASKSQLRENDESDHVSENTKSGSNECQSGDETCCKSEESVCEQGGEVMDQPEQPTDPCSIQAADYDELDSAYVDQEDHTCQAEKDDVQCHENGLDVEAARRKRRSSFLLRAREHIERASKSSRIVAAPQPLNDTIKEKEHMPKQQEDRKADLGVGEDDVNRSELADEKEHERTFSASDANIGSARDSDEAAEKLKPDTIVSLLEEAPLVQDRIDAAQSIDEERGKQSLAGLRLEQVCSESGVGGQIVALEEQHIAHSGLSVISSHLGKIESKLIASNDRCAMSQKLEATFNADSAEKHKFMDAMATASNSTLADTVSCRFENKSCQAIANSCTRLAHTECQSEVKDDLKYGRPDNVAEEVKVVNKETKQQGEPCLEQATQHALGDQRITRSYSPHRMEGLRMHSPTESHTFPMEECEVAMFEPARALEANDVQSGSESVISAKNETGPVHVTHSQRERGSFGTGLACSGCSELKARILVDADGLMTYGMDGNQGQQAAGKCGEHIEAQHSIFDNSDQKMTSQIANEVAQKEAADATLSPGELGVTVGTRARKDLHEAQVDVYGSLSTTHAAAQRGDDSSTFERNAPHNDSEKMPSEMFVFKRITSAHDVKGVDESAAAPFVFKHMTSANAVKGPGCFASGSNHHRERFTSAFSRPTGYHNAQTQFTSNTIKTTPQFQVVAAPEAPRQVSAPDANVPQAARSFKTRGHLTVSGNAFSEHVDESYAIGDDWQQGSIPKHRKLYVPTLSVLQLSHVSQMSERKELTAAPKSFAGLFAPMLSPRSSSDYQGYMGEQSDSVLRTSVSTHPVAMQLYHAELAASNRQLGPATAAATSAPTAAAPLAPSSTVASVGQRRQRRGGADACNASRIDRQGRSAVQACQAKRWLWEGYA